MLELSSLFTDEKAENDGVWCPFGKGAEIKIAREGNEEYQKLLNRKVQANRAILDQNDDMARETGEQILNEVYAATVIKDWRGFSINNEQVEEGKYTAEKGLLILKDRNVREKIRAYAQSAANYRKEREDAAVKK